MPTPTYLSSATKQRQCRLNGVQRSTRLPAKVQLQGRFSHHMRFTAPQLPPKVNLRYQMTPVENQSSIGSWSDRSSRPLYCILSARYLAWPTHLPAPTSIC